MKKLLFVLTASLAISSVTNAQVYFTKNGKLSFFSKTAMENIEASNNQTLSVINSKTGEMSFSVLVNGFLFKKALMQEHFNENYMESAKYPKATFKGTIVDPGNINYTKDGNYIVSVSGDLMIHGATNKVTVPGAITIKGGKVSATATFNVLLADYKISVPKLVEGNISKSIEIRVDCNYEPK